MKRVSLSILTTFNSWLNDDAFTTRQDVIDMVVSPFEGNAYTRLGQAFHSIVEHGKKVCTELPDGRIRVLSDDGQDCYFNSAQVQVALDYKARFPNALHEVPRSKLYHTAEGDIYVTMRIDLIDGLVIHDIKTKYGIIDDAPYYLSPQAPFYMEVLGLNEFYYDLFKIERYNTKAPTQDVSQMGISVYEPSIHVIRYPKMEHDNLLLVQEFIKFAKENNIYDKLKDYNPEQYE